MKHWSMGLPITNVANVFTTRQITLVPIYGKLGAWDPSVSHDNPEVTTEQNANSYVVYENQLQYINVSITQETNCSFQKRF